MKKINRGLGNEEFQLIISKGKFISSKIFVIYWIPMKFAESRIGIGVSKKLGNAVKRNKIRRQVKDIIVNVYDFKAPLDIVIMVRKDYITNTIIKNKDDLNHLIRKIG